MAENIESQNNRLLEMVTVGPLRIIISVLVPVITFFVLRASFIFMRDSEAPKLAIAAIALVVGVAGVWILYWATNMLVENLSDRWKTLLRPYVFVGPAITILGIYLVYPAVYTIILSFFDARTENFVGLSNYLFRACADCGILTDQTILIAFRNNILWLIFVTFFSVSFGLLVAILVDRIKLEAVAKSLIFLPMAISFVGASVIWRFVYYFQPQGRDQIGLLNAVLTGFGGEPQAWLTLRPWNNFFLIIIMIWLQTGFAMVILSAAIKGVPGELLEAGRIDGANEVQIFFRIIIPYIRGTIITVTTTILILVLKVFDIVFVMTSGQLGTEVIANRMYSEMFKFRNFGQGSALAVILLIAVIPALVSNLRNLNES